ncbi:MAG TPA: hypothetical protein VF844_16735, partial [Ktedonobacteraceae bacterium]
MPCLHGRLLTACCEMLAGILADRLQHAEARLSTRALLGVHQALVQELCHLLEGRSLLLTPHAGSSREADRLHPLQGEPTHKDREASEELLFACLQEVVAPGNGVAQRLLARGQVTGPPAEQRQTVREPCQQRRGSQQREACGGQLQGERQPVQALAELD